jgi:hypothetical protein
VIGRSGDAAEIAICACFAGIPENPDNLAAEGWNIVVADSNLS